MAPKRTGYAPWSLTREAGVESATVNGTIEVPQFIQPTLSTGFVDERGNWQGTKSNDREFAFYSKDEEIANGGEILTPTDTGSLSMVGFSDMQIAIKPTNGGNYRIEAVMGSDGSQPYYNLSPPNAAAILRGTVNAVSDKTDFESMLVDAAESLTADVWNIFYIQERLKNQARLAFKITNNSGGNSTIETMYLRLV
tara:strand:- start:323 stop:910 length:588 start_codon:yes stop_codon:yes gene_type:complete